MPVRSVGTQFLIDTQAVTGITSIAGIEKTADTLDTTTLDSDGGYRTFVGGFKDGGEVTLSGYFAPGNPGQTLLDSAFEAGDVHSFQIVFPPELGASWVFDGVVTGFSTSADLEELVGFETTIKVSGKPTLATTPSAGLSALTVTGTGGTLVPSFANNNYYYTFDGVTGNSVTVTATAANHTLKLYVDGKFVENLQSGVASSAIALTLNVGRKIMIYAQETGKTPVIYQIIAVKTA